MSVRLDQITIGDLRIVVLDVDPMTGTGYTESIGSLAIVSGSAGLYQKTSTGDNDWTIASVNAEDVQDIVGAMSADTATIDFTYSDSLGTLSAILKALSVDNTHIATNAAIAMSKLAAMTVNKALVSDGSGFVTTSATTATELGYVSGVTSAIQTQLNSKIPSAEKGANNGVAPLDSGGKIAAQYLPNTVMEFQGTWNASTNSPTLADGIGNTGDVYLATVAGTQNLGSGNIVFAVGDWAVYNGTIWQKSINSNAVVSVNGQQGVVVLTTANISEDTNLYFTDERAQDAVGGALADSSSIDFTYSDAGNSITAVVLPAGVNHNALANLTTGDAHTQYALLAGRSGGQTLNGDTTSAGNLTLGSTANATKGKVLVGSAAAIDEANSRLGVGTISPVSVLDLVENTVKYGLRGSSTSTTGSVNAAVSIITPVADTVEFIKVFVTGLDTVSFSSVAYERTVKIKNIGGTVSLGTIQSDYTDEDPSLSSANCTFVVNASDVEVRVTGVNARTITWKCFVQRIR